MSAEDKLPTAPQSIDLAELFCKLQDQLLAKQNLVRSAITHPGTKGDASEVNWLQLLRDYLPSRYQIEKAFLVDSKGTLSQQQDIVIFDRQYSPFILNESGALYVPAESVYAVIEAKQEFNRDHVIYAADKAASVRSLHRTSAAIQHAGGTYPPKKPFRIPAGIVTVSRGWKEAFGEPFIKVLKETAASEERQIDFGCVLDSGGFSVSYDASGEPTISHSDPSFAVMHFLLNLFRTLQFLGTVPAIDVLEYLEWLKKRECPEECPVVSATPDEE
jgi:hypothetical protein